MDGILVYAEIFASWIENLSVFWNFLNTNVLVFIQSSIDSISGNPDSYLAVGFFSGLKSILWALGLGDLTVLGFLFSIMGFGFGIYFCIMLIRWVLDLLP